MILLWNSAAMTVQLTLVDGENRHDYEWQAGRELARDMLGYLRDKLAEHDIALADIAGIGVYRGPGSYTGLRIGMTVLNTLASSLAIPIVGVVDDSWQADALARLAGGDDDKIVLPEYGGEAHITAPKK